MNKRQENLPSVQVLWKNYDYNYFKGQLLSKMTGKPIAAHQRNRNYYFTISWWQDGSKHYYATTVGRIVMAWITGHWPTLDVDHINRDTTDNRVLNLRTVTVRVNSINRSSFKGGITQQKSGNWRARIRVNGKQHTIGTYATKQEAIAAYEYACVSEKYWADKERKSQ